jgi:hypothetical protein
MRRRVRRTLFASSCYRHKHTKLRKMPSAPPRLTGRTNWHTAGERAVIG